MASVEDLLCSEQCIRVFGYGSLIWKPDFEYDNKYEGYIEGYERRFWQGSVHHRGTVERPGRCLTVTKMKNGRCSGVVFEVTGAEKIKAALEHLETRERHIGGYDAVIVPVHISDVNGNMTSLQSIMYYATPENELFMDQCICCMRGLDTSTQCTCLEVMAEEIATARGVCGYNCEYLLRTTDYMRMYLPEEKDEHLYQLDRLVRMRLGLGPSNVLPWTSLVRMKSFCKNLKRCTGMLDCEKFSDNMIRMS